MIAYFQKKHIFASIAILYLIVEAQAWTLISRLYTTVLNPETLSEYERFGYASAGIGITFFALRMLYPAAKSKKQKAGVLLSLPFLYILFVWLMYELVHQSPGWVPEAKRHLAAKSAINTLANPGWNNLFSFYSNRSKQEDDVFSLTRKVKKMVTQYPLSDRAVQSTYISGIQSVNMFSEYYKKHSKILEKEVMDDFIGQIGYMAWFDFSEKIKASDLKPKLFTFASHMNAARYNPMRWPNAWIKAFLFYETDPLLRMIISVGTADYIEYGVFDYTSLDHFQLSEIGTEIYIWEKMREELPSMPEYLDYTYRSDEPFNERVRRAYSRFMLDKYTYMPNTEIPWLKNGADPLQSNIYDQAMRQVVPFFIGADGAPIITFERVYDDETRRRYINTLKKGLPVQVRDAWTSYQINTLTKLAISPEHWKLPTEYAIHKDTLRVGAVIPVMVALSGLLIVLNIFMLFRTHYAYGLAGVAITGVVYLGPSQLFENVLIKAIISISVSEAQIFLY
jgi:hypothetical protein